MPSAQQLNGLLNRIGNFDPTEFQRNFDKRLVLQKTVYLLQAFGLNIGYRYTWYLRGPYSPDLTKVAYSVATNYDPNAFAGFHETENEERFCKFLIFLGEKKNDEDWMEIAASIHFLARLYGEQNKSLVFEKVRGKVGNLSRETFNDIWNRLCQNGLLARETT